MTGLFVPASSSAATTGLRQVGTRCMLPNNNLGATTGAWQGSTFAHYVRANSPNGLILVYPNFRIGGGGGEQTYAAGNWIKASVLRFRDGAMAVNNEGAVAYPVGFTVLTVPGAYKAGDLILINTLLQSDQPICFKQFQNSGTVASPWDGWQNGTGTPVDNIASGTPYARNVITFGPCLILVNTSWAAWLLFGDSRGEGGTEGITDASLDVGLQARAIGPNYGYTTFESSGTLLSGYLAAARTYRDMIALGTIPGLPGPYFTRIGNAYGINDLNGGGKTEADLAQDSSTLAGLYGVPGLIEVVGQTLMSASTTTDGAATKANQNIVSNGTTRTLAFNTIRRSGIPGERRCIEVADFFDPKRTGYWPVTRNPYDTAIDTPWSVTGSIASFSLNTTGTLTKGSNQLTGLASTSGLIVGMNVFSTVLGLPFGTTIRAISGSTVTLSKPFGGATTAGAAISFAGGVLTVTAVNSGTVALQDPVYASGIQPSSKIIGFGTGTGGTGTYCLNWGSTIAAGSTITKAGFATLDNLHQTAAYSELVRDQTMAAYIAASL